MKYGFSLIGSNPRHYAQLAQAAEAAGFESIWLPEHLLFPVTMPADYPYSESGLPITPSKTPLYDPWIMLAAIGAVTTTIRLATNVFILPLRHPLMTARQLVTLDRISGGRVTLGAGVGWLRDEFDAVGLDFTKRGRMTDEIIPLLRRLWSEEEIEHHGTFYDFEPINFEPKPIQRVNGVKGIPIELGGASAPALRRAGTLCDGWIEIGGNRLEDVAANIATINQHRESAGRADLPYEITLGAAMARTADQVAQARELGVTRLLAIPPFDINQGGAPLETSLAFIERTGRETIGRA
jgi:probable F420-dependent oxidoreductase